MNAVYGAGGFGREVMAFVNDGVFVDQVTGRANGYDVISEEELIEKKFPFTIAIADSKVRQEIAERLIGFGLEALIVIGPNVTVCENVECRTGTILCPGVVVGANARMGLFFHANFGSYVAHDCEIGDYVTFAPKVCCNGRVKIGDHAYIGAGAMIRQGLEIGEGAVVGMGAVVTKDVPPNVTVVGNPAKELVK